MLDRNKKRNTDMVPRETSYPSLFPRDWISDFFNDGWPGTSPRFADVRVDVRETEDAFLIDAELPGMSKDDIDITLDNDMLTIRAHQETQSEEKDDKGRYIRRERHSGTFQRSFMLENVKSDEITADMKDGVLTIRLPKQEPQAPTARKIDIG